MTNPSTNRFTWHELMTTDTTAATKFYAGLFGWTTEEMDMGPAGKYTLFKIGDKQVGGALKAQPGMPSAWLVYVGSEDIDKSIARIKEHGGNVVVPTTTVPNMVQFAIAIDPQGAAFGVVKNISQRPDEAPPAGPPSPGTFCWDELHTKDQQAAGKYYGAVFGWTGKVGEDAMKYWHWLNQGKDIGGMMTLQMPNVPPHWLGYIASANVDAACAKAKELGAKVVVDPMEVPKVGRFAVLVDPTGAAFAVYKSASV